MTIEIWSDIACPFCYIGKRHLEAALNTFPHRDEVKIVWKSFLLDPSARFEEGMTTKKMLIEKKGVSPSQIDAMLTRVTDMAAKVGLTYHFDQVIPASSVLGHRLIHLAKEFQKESQTKEALLRVHFIDGKNIEDHNVLIEVGTSVGIVAERIEGMLASDEKWPEVKNDFDEGHGLGVTGVPFFVFDRKYAISGAQPIEAFSETLEETWAHREDKVRN